jgi:hypothetical protein
MSNNDKEGSGKSNGEQQQQQQQQELTPAAKAYLEIMKKQSEAAAAGQGGPRVVTLDGTAGAPPQEHKFWNTQVSRRRR